MATERDAADMTGPAGGVIGTPATGATVGRTTLSAVNITTATQVIDLSDTNHFAGDFYVMRFVRIICDQGIFYYWSNNAAAVLDETKKDGTNRDQQCDWLPSSTPREEVPSGRYFVVKGQAAGTARLSIVQTYKPGQ